jgi:hypothetical protein
MSPLFGPILAQLVTLGVGDRTEARVIRADTTYEQAATYPRVGLSFGWKHFTLSVGYGPSLTLGPLNSKDPILTVFHSGGISGLYKWQRTTLIVSQSLGYGEVNFQELALAGQTAQPTAAAPPTTTAGGTTPPPAGGVNNPGTTPAPGTTVPTANQSRAPLGPIKFMTSSTNVVVNHAITPALLVGAGAGYTVTGSPGDDSSVFPISQGPFAEVHASDRFTQADAANLLVSTQLVRSSTGNDAWVLSGTAGWGRAWSPRTTTQVGSGVSMSRNSQFDGLVFWSIYPTFFASISRVVPAGRGAFNFGSAVACAPAIDPISASVDPRLSLSGSANWSLARFFMGLSAGTAVSIAQQNNGAFNSLYAAFNTGFNLGAGFSVDGGVRAFRQRVSGNTTPASYAAFLGVSFAAAVPLSH